ncbi:MAG TPA: histone deacetylase family protein [Actinomycetota bacterium]|nr:histone deacetylase family protein [Actinomycetota bacterium]
MRVVYTPRHLLHDPDTEVQYGVPLPMYEVPQRAERIRAALEEDGGFELVPPAEHGVGPIEAVHEPAMVRYLEEAWRDWRTVNRAPQAIPDTILHPALREGMGPAREPVHPLARLGYWCFETMNPIVPGTYEAARWAVDVALTAADLVLGGEPAAYGLCRPPGHHAPRAAFGGYCFFNNAAIAAEELVRRTGEPVAILDVDYHHGNGTQQIFYGRGDVLYVSLHGHPDRAYPYFAGYEDETGTGAGAGANLNIPLPAGCTDDAYLRALDRALERIEEHGGSILVVSLGFDTYGQDPIADLALTTPVYHEVGRRVAALGRRLVILQEGGYHVPHLGANAVNWLRGVEGRELDLRGLQPDTRWPA